MVIQIALVVAMILQILAAIISIRLTRVTKYNLSWMLISTGFILLAVRRFIELIPLVSDATANRKLFVWLGIIASVFFAIGLLLIQKIFQYMKRVEDEKREMEKRLLHATIRAEENERKRFAKDLHDELGPLLSSVKMSISTVVRREYDIKSEAILRSTDLAIDEAIKSIREISNNLSPHILENFGLTKAIQNFIHKINLTNAIQIDFSTNINDLRFENDIEVVTYRVLCELITNTLKHAHARHVDIKLAKTGSELHCSYSDDGIGFQVAGDEGKFHSHGMGFSNIVSRITSLDGKFDYTSEQGKGISAFFTIPVNK